LLANPNTKDFEFVPLLHASLLLKVEEIRLALDGVITPRTTTQNEDYFSAFWCFETLQVQS
jgi:hypothetical protein